jgi:AraC-like DNA-binding protein
MPDQIAQIDIPVAGHPALTLSGPMETHSTRTLHMHSYHQVLCITNGVTLLEDPDRKQPLFGNMTAFIPAHLPHRSTVIGAAVQYKSLYLSPELFKPEQQGIRLFSSSSLGAALFERIDIRDRKDLSSGLNQACLDLLLKILPEDMQRPVDLVRVPQPRQPHNRKVISFIEKNYTRQLTMDDVTAAMPYCARHLSRQFKADLKITIFEYLRLYRILMASIALSDTSRTITQAAYDAGYDSVSSFYRDFNIFFACTPRVFRDRRANG